MAQCARYKRVRSKFGGTVRRCAKFSGRTRKGRRKSRSGYARGGSRCVRYKRVRVRGGGVQRRCAKFSGGSSRRSGYRKSKSRSKRPFNKGKKCKRFGVSRKTGAIVCRSYGSRKDWRGLKKKAPRRPLLMLGPGRPQAPSFFR